MTFFRSKQRIVLIIVGFLFLATVYLLVTRRSQSSPYKDILFIEDRPGANSRYVSFTPVLRDNPKVVVGPTAGADYGRIYFEDLDGDGTKETIVQTQLPLFDTGEFYSDTKEILRYTKMSDGTPRMVTIDSILNHK